MTQKFVIALDQGTTSSRAVAVDRLGKIRMIAQQPFAQHFPQPGWVEHDPQEILSTQMAAFTELVVRLGLERRQIDSIGITNQRETTVIWDRESSLPVCNAIVWQCRRSAPIIEAMCADKQFERYVQATTGLVPDAYFSAGKIKWILDNVEGVRSRAKAGELAFGTVDSWLIWALTHGQIHATDPTNASRTMLYNIHKGCWDADLLEAFGIPASLLPEVRPSSADFGQTAHPGLPQGIPIRGVAGDQQAALFGQGCFASGEAKNTYGTGCFLLMHTGEVAYRSKHRLLTTIAASPPAKPSQDHATLSQPSPQSTQGQTPPQTPPTEYALEGSVFVAGALIQWLRDELKLISSAPVSEQLALEVKDSGGVYIVPAFTGLGAPYWDSHARGLICGLTRGTKREHIVRAALESLAFQVYDLVKAMQEDTGSPIHELKVDGGAAANNFLMQFQSDLLQAKISRSSNLESTALGAAFLAGLKTGFWQDTDQLRSLLSKQTAFTPQMKKERCEELLAGWSESVLRAQIPQNSSNPQTLKPSNPQTLKPSNPQTLKQLGALKP